MRIAMVGWQLFCQGDGSPSEFQTHTYTHTFTNILDMIAIIGTSDQPCWLAEACKIPSLEGLWMYGVMVYTAVTWCNTVTNLIRTGTILRNSQF